MNTKQITCSSVAGGKLVCPWQIAPLMDNAIRPLIHNPRRLFSPYIRPGMTVLDVGCGAGFASLGLAGLVDIGVPSVDRNFQSAAGRGGA